MPKKIQPIHPREILNEEFLKPLNLTQYRLAKDISVPPRRINEIVHGILSITADTALRLGHYFNISPYCGLIFKHAMILKLNRINLLNLLKKSRQISNGLI